METRLSDLQLCGLNDPSNQKATELSPSVLEVTSGLGLGLRLRLCLGNPSPVLPLGQSLFPPFIFKTINYGKTSKEAKSSSEGKEMFSSIYAECPESNRFQYVLPV